MVRKSELAPFVRRVMQRMAKGESLTRAVEEETRLEETREQFSRAVADTWAAWKKAGVVAEGEEDGWVRWARGVLADERARRKQAGGEVGPEDVRLVLDCRMGKWARRGR